MLESAAYASRRGGGTQALDQVPRVSLLRISVPTTTQLLRAPFGYIRRRE